jgi:hypothetical protein
VKFPLTLASIVSRKEGLLDTKIDNEIVALDIDSGACYGLNSVGSRIWVLMSEPVRIRDICAKLLTEFRIDAPACERQVLDLLEELRAEGLVTAREE